MCCPLCTWKRNKQLSHVHVHDTSTIRRMWIYFLLIFAWLYVFLQTSQLGVLSCHVNLLYEKELHKSLSRQVVYSFYEICNGCVALVKLVSLVGIYVYIQSVYITYMYIFVSYFWQSHLDFFDILKTRFHCIINILGMDMIYFCHQSSVERACLVLTAFSMYWMVVCTWIGVDDVLFCNRSWNVFSSSLLELQTMRFQVMQLKKRPFDPKWLPSPSYVVFCHLYSWLCLSCPTINKSTSVLKCLSLGLLKQIIFKIQISQFLVILTLLSSCLQWSLLQTWNLKS